MGRQYDPAQVVLIYGDQVITGFADGTFINVERLEDMWTDESGADGEVTRIKQNDYRGTITITLQASSPANAFLSALATEDEVSNSGARAVSLLDKNGPDGLQTIASGDKAWAVKKPSSGYAKAPENREWTLRVARLNYELGAHAEI